ncbi:MAG: hypothetical protein R3E90_00955 [Marinicella sp.]|nr:hypothetical protein [Xanthomonadales bacterium]
MNVFNFYRSMSIVDKKTIALLLTDYQTCLNVKATAYKSPHAEILSLLIQTTAQDLGISDIKSDKNKQQCIVTFTEGEKYQRWKFEEATDILSANFLNHALEYVANKANGRFFYMYREDTLRCYLFIPNGLFRASNTV